MTKVTIAQLRAELNDGRGLQCPKCGCRHFEVGQTRKVLGRIVRHRLCRHCGRRMLTAEVPLSEAMDIEEAARSSPTKPGEAGKATKSKRKKKSLSAD